MDSTSSSDGNLDLLPSGNGRHLRADAMRNRKKVLASAREVFAEAGSDAQIDDVARRAGVGIGTVYRHFPTKEALLEAIVLDAFEQLTAEAERALEDPDPWRGFSGFVRAAVANYGQQRALGDVMCSVAGSADGPIRAGRDTALESLDSLLHRAQAAGLVRPDITSSDLQSMLLGLARTPSMGHVDPTTSRERWLAVILDGLRVTRSRHDAS